VPIGKLPPTKSVRRPTPPLPPTDHWTVLAEPSSPLRTTSKRNAVTTPVAPSARLAEVAETDSRGPAADVPDSSESLRAIAGRISDS
jgi:hypothetical protein